MVPRWPCFLEIASPASLSPNTGMRGGSEKKEQKAKCTKTETPSKGAARNRRRIPGTIWHMALPTSRLKDGNASPHNLRVYYKIKKDGTNTSILHTAWRLRSQKTKDLS